MEVDGVLTFTCEQNDVSKRYRKSGPMEVVYYGHLRKQRSVNVTEKVYVRMYFTPT